MSEDHQQSDSRFTVKVAAESHFAWMRTRLAVERTILAWIRTAVSLIALETVFSRAFRIEPGAFAMCDRILASSTGVSAMR